MKQRRILFLAVFCLIAGAAIWILWRPGGKPTPGAPISSHGSTNAQAFARDLGETNGLFNLITMTNLSGWKKAIEGFWDTKNGLFQTWVMECPGESNGIPLRLTLGSNSVLIKPVLIEADAYNGKDHLFEEEMHLEAMPIEKVRELGLRLCTVIGCEPSKFLEWCDSAGNHGERSPFGGVSKKFPDLGLLVKLRTFHAFAPDRPWYIEIEVDYLEKVSN
jgi:hypothetical protein